MRRIGVINLFGVIFFILTAIVSVEGQNDLMSTDTLVKGDLYEIKNKRSAHVDFHRAMTSIRNPSTLSALTNYRWHTNGYEKKPFILDGDLNLPIAIKGPEFCNLLNTFQVIPRFQFRIFANDSNFPYAIGDTSNPVRTPSAMPGVAWYMTHARHWDNSHSATNKDRNDFYWGIYIYHHSNGQDGAELDTTDGVVRVNLYNGNFGEQLVFEPTVGGRRVFEFKEDLCEESANNLGDIVDQRMTSSKILYWQMSYEWRPDALTNSVFDKYDIYGKNRVKVMLNYIKLITKFENLYDGVEYTRVTNESVFEKFRWVMNMSYIADANYKTGDISDLKDVSIFDVSKRLNVDLSVHYIPDWTKNLAFFIKVGYTGSDEYNIYFQDSYAHFKMGASFAFFDQPDWQIVTLKHHRLTQKNY